MENYVESFIHLRSFFLPKILLKKKKTYELDAEIIVYLKEMSIISEKKEF